MKKSEAAFWMCCIFLAAACGDDKPGDSVPSGPITVTGKVWRTQGVPETKALVLIPGNDRKPVVVDAQGGFSIPNVTPPYELMVRMTTARDDKAYVRLYKELTRKDPVVFNVEGDSFAARSNILKGKVTGVQSTPENARVYVGHALPMRQVLWFQAPFGGSTSADASGAFSFESDWSTNPAEAGSLYALQYTLENDRPKRYLAYGRRDQVSFQTSAPALDIAMSPVTTSSISLEISGTATDSRHDILLNLEHTPTLTTDMSSRQEIEATSSFPVPVIPDATFQFVGYSTGDDTLWGRGGLKAGESLKVVVPPGIKAISPTSQAVDVPLTATLSWTEFPNALYTQRISCGDYRVVVDQTAPQLTLPDLRVFDMPLKGDVICSWSGMAFSPVKSANEMVGLNYAKQEEQARTGTVYLSLLSVGFRLAR